MNISSMPVITSIQSRRIIVTVRGRAPKELIRNITFDLYEENQKKAYEPTLVMWHRDQFRIDLNVVSMNANNPLIKGDYYLRYHSEKNSSYIKLAQEDDFNQELYYEKEEILEDIALLEKEYYDTHTFFDKEELEQSLEKQLVHVKKSGKHHIECHAMTDLDTGDLLFRINSAVPGPRKNFMRKFLGEWYHGIKGDLSDFHKKNKIRLFRIFSKYKRKKKKVILFASGSRSTISGNEEFIYNRMCELGYNKEYIFKKDFKENISKKRNPFAGIRFIWRLATSDVIMIDDYYPDVYIYDYKSTVKFIQVWHACGAFKALGLERMAKKGAPPLNTRVHKCYTHVPVSSMHSALHHQEAFGIELSKFYPVGIPRTDIFFDDSYKEKICEQMYQEFPRSKDAAKVIMYAPTFRGNNALDAYFPMDKFDLDKWGKLCKEHNWYLIIKMHPFVTQKVEIPEAYKEYIVDATSYREVNDILFITDLLITDYSSIIYEFSLLNRPMLFYAFDQKMYESTRDFYETYEDIVPGKIIKKFDELLEVIQSESYDTERLEWFVKKNFTYRDGKATDRVIELITK